MKRKKSVRKLSSSRLFPYPAFGASNNASKDEADLFFTYTPRLSEGNSLKRGVTQID